MISRKSVGLAAVGALVAGGLAMVPSVASAQEYTSRYNPRQGVVTNGLYHRLGVAVRLNPLGLFVEGRFGYRRRLFHGPRSGILFKNTYAGLAATLAVSPAFVRPGISLEVQPLQILHLMVTYEPLVQWFGTFNYLQSFSNDEARANFSDDEIRRRSALAQTARGWQLTLSGTLQVKIGDLAVRSNFRGVRASYDGLRNNDPNYYDIFFDVLAPNNGWTFLNDSDVIYQMSDLGLNIGVRYSAVVPLFEGGALDGVQTATHRVGPLVSYTFRERRHSFFNAPTVFVLAQWWLAHRYRTGDGPESITQGLPMIVFGFSFRGDS